MTAAAFDVFVAIWLLMAVAGLGMLALAAYDRAHKAIERRRDVRWARRASVDGGCPCGDCDAIKARIRARIDAELAQRAEFER